MSARPRIGELLVNLGQLTPEQLEAALEQQRTQGAAGRRLGQLLVDLGFISEVQLTKVLSQHLSVPWVSLHHIDFSRQLLNLVPKEIAEEFCVIPIYVRHERKVGDTLYLAMEDPTHDDAVRSVMAACGMPVKSMIAAPSDIRGAIRAFYGGSPSESAPPMTESDEAPAPVSVPRASKPAAPPPTPPSAARKPPPPPPKAATRPTLPEPVVAPAEPAPTPAAASIEEAAPIFADVPAEEPTPPPAAAADEDGFDVHDDQNHPDTVPPPPGATHPAETHAAATAEEPTLPTFAHRPSLPAMPAAPVVAARTKRAPAAAPPAKTGGPRMIALTLLDGTSIQIPAQRKRSGTEAQPAQPTAAEHEAKLTTRDLIAALRAVANGADADEALGDTRWETVVAALLAVLLRKQLISDWEFVEEWHRGGGI